MRLPVLTWTWQTVRQALDDRYRDLFDGPEAYHAHVETGSLARARVIAAWIEPGAAVLDAGCGDGAVARYLVDTRGSRVRGVDNARGALEKCATRGITADRRDLDREPLAWPEPVDYVLLLEVLEHLARPHLVLREAAALARRGVIVSIPNSGFLPYRLQLLRGVFPRWLPTVRRGSRMRGPSGPERLTPCRCPRIWPDVASGSWRPWTTT